MFRWKIILNHRLGEGFDFETFLGIYWEDKFTKAQGNLIREGSKKNPEKVWSLTKLGGGSPRVHQKTNPKRNNVFFK